MERTKALLGDAKEVLTHEVSFLAFGLLSLSGFSSCMQDRVQAAAAAQGDPGVYIRMILGCWHWGTAGCEVPRPCWGTQRRCSHTRWVSQI
jgi:hypothetical protein